MTIIINEVNIYNSSLEPKPPIGAKWLIEFFDTQFHNKIYVPPSELYPDLIDSGIYDLDFGTSYTFITDKDEVETIINNIITN